MQIFKLGNVRLYTGYILILYKCFTKEGGINYD